MKITRYGLWHPELKVLMGYDTVAGESLGNPIVEYSLTPSNTLPWLVTNPELAQQVACSNPVWSETAYDSPRNIFYDEDLKVAKVEIIIDE